MRDPTLPRGPVLRRLTELIAAVHGALAALASIAYVCFSVLGQTW